MPSTTITLRALAGEARSSEAKADTARTVIVARIKALDSGPGLPSDAKFVAPPRLMGVSAGPPWALASCSQGIVVSSRSAEDADVCAVIDHKNVQVRQHHSPAGER